jgi:hypothetical protein
VRRADATHGGFLSSDVAVKKRDITVSTTAAIPPSSTAFRRVSIDAGSDTRAVVFASTRCVSRSGACAPSHWPTMPPSDSPQNAK